jgi:hypothetical protein
MAGRITVVELFAAMLLFSAVALFDQDSPASPGARQTGASRDSQRLDRILWPSQGDTDPTRLRQFPGANWQFC